jgi:seryl-tRNA synthetase
MAAARKRRTVTLLKERAALDRMSKSLAQHQKEVNSIRKVVAKKLSTDEGFGLIEALNTLSDHVARARKELEMALDDIKQI